MSREGGGRRVSAKEQVRQVTAEGPAPWLDLRKQADDGVGRGDGALRTPSHRLGAGWGKGHQNKWKTDRSLDYSGGGEAHCG